MLHLAGSGFLSDPEALCRHEPCRLSGSHGSPPVKRYYLKWACYISSVCPCWRSRIRTCTDRFSTLILSLVLSPVPVRLLFFRHSPVCRLSGCPSRFCASYRLAISPCSTRSVWVWPPSLQPGQHFYCCNRYVGWAMLLPVYVVQTHPDPYCPAALLLPL